MAQHPMLAKSDVSAPGFAGAYDLPACRDPAQAFRFLCEPTARGGQQQYPGISLSSWVRLAPGMGLADFITADATFDQLANVDEELSIDERFLSEEVFTRYCERISAKSWPGAAKVGGGAFRKSNTADNLLKGSMLSQDEKVLMAGGVPSYLVQDMTTTPRSSGTLILTTHALYWRPNSLTRQAMGKIKAGGGNVKCLPLYHTEGGEWLIESCSAGPFGLGVTDTALRIRRRLSLSDTEALGKPETCLRFNFPMNTEIRDTFLAGISEVLAVHAFCVRNLAQPPGVLPPAVTTALLGAIVRHRAARALDSHGGPNRCKLPFSVVAAETAADSSPSSLTQQVAELLLLADERQRRAAEAVAAAFGKDAVFVNQDADSAPTADPGPRLGAVSGTSGAISGNRGAISLKKSISVLASVEGEGNVVAKLPRSNSFPPPCNLVHPEEEAENKHDSQLRRGEGGGAGSGWTGAEGGGGGCKPKFRGISGGERGAADKVIAAVAARRMLARGAERAQASFAALPVEEEERRVRRIRHNMRLIETLLLLPLQHMRESVQDVLIWKNPFFSSVVLALLQVLVLYEKLHYLPGLLFIGAAANIIEFQRQKRAEGGGAYVVEYYFEITRDGPIKRARRLEQNLAKVDAFVQAILVVLLKTHSAATSVDERLTLRFALSLLAFGVVLSLSALLTAVVPVWLVLSTLIVIVFAAKHPLLSLLQLQVSQQGAEAGRRHLGRVLRGGGWEGDIGSDMGTVFAASLWSLSALIPVVCVVPLERVIAVALVCFGITAVALRLFGTKGHGDPVPSREGEGGGRDRDRQTDRQTDRGEGGVGSVVWRADLDRQVRVAVREWWDLLPAPKVRNKAEIGDVS
jgi:hypothetical protein